MTARKLTRSAHSHKNRLPRTGTTMRTLSTMPYRRGDVVLVPYPFVERDASKRRPALVVSADTYNAACPDIILALVTSKTGVSARPGDHKIADWRGAGLIGPSLVRSRLATLHHSR